MLPRDLSSLSTFLLVAEERSFTRAAKRQGVSPSAVSHSMRALEEEVGVRLLARTTRSVALTEAGEQLLRRLRPALAEVGETLEEISGGREKAAGRIRLLLPRLAVSSVLAPKLAKLSREFPDIILDVTTDDSRRDIVAEGFDAGIHFGEYIQKDMIAVRVSPDQRPAIVGSSDYLESHPRPKLPRDLLLHRCINFRHGSAGFVPMGIRKRNEVSFCSCDRVAGCRRLGTRDSRSGRRCRSSLRRRTGSRYASCRRNTRACASGLVSTVPRLLHLLPEPTAEDRRAFSSRQRFAILKVLGKGEISTDKSAYGERSPIMLTRSANERCGVVRALEDFVRWRFQGERRWIGSGGG